MSTTTFDRVYTGTIEEQEDAADLDAIAAPMLGWEPIRREEMPDSLRVTYRIIGSDLPIEET